MNIGLPGTGIGGFFYLLSAFFILGAEVYLTLIGKSSLKRWMLIREKVSIAIAMVVMAVATNYVLSLYVFTKRPAEATVHSNNVLVATHTFYQIHPILIPITLLFLVLLTTNLLRASLLYWYNPRIR